MFNPLVSVIIPTYNRPLLTCEALQSVLSQSYRSFEVIIVDDGSTDSTEEELHHFMAELSEEERSCIHIVSLDHNGFPGAVRNRAVERSRGSYLAFLDSDDLWMEEKLEKQVRFFQDNPDIRLCHTRERWLRGEKIISQSKLRHQREGDIFSDALKKCIIGPSTVMVEHSFFKEHKGFREDLEIAEDYELWLRMAAVENVGYIDIPLITKRAGHGEQLSEKYGHIEIFRIQALRDLVLSGDFSEEKASMAHKELLRKLEIYIAGCRKRGKSEEAGDMERLYLSLK